MTDSKTLWSSLCANAECFRLDLKEFSRFEDFFLSLDHGFFLSCAEKVLTGFPYADVTQRIPAGDLEKFYLLCIVYNYRNARELYRRSGWPDECFKEVSGDLKLWAENGLRDFGHCGISQRVFTWETDCLTGRVKQFGRLQCNDISLFAPRLSLYRQEDGSVISLPAFQRDNPPSPDLTFGDRVINLHIPASGPLDPVKCMDSVKRMCRFSREYHPDYDFKAVVCYSWLLDPQFREFLPESSNIIRFQDLGHLLVWEESEQTEEVIWRIWGNPGLNMPVEKLPQNNSLERGTAEFLKQGRRFREGILVIFQDELFR